ncbi:MAG: helix-hairpin-helix domain-containing protein [Candidatus Nanopelagicaceae bacterium]|jgi:competence protein ComEA|nr:ComEA family DNA-binding protein [Actinomycetota bacterium]NDA40300.1 ComEA family DNA-binding protein [Actinomycetota bacterium]NDE47867.1 ComEA family DNA-binding protein [Actinomycetota bacterium]NDE95636.1 ComEA family DNA-binding protein [Actinomycetota bacterium]NDG09637.1 ComEA family DNA-binding protein [Actinomycetota bacterium]
MNLLKEKFEELKSQSLEYTTEQKRAVIALSLVAIFIAGVLFLSSRGEAVETPAIKVIESAPSKMLLVHVAGEVKRPGVYPVIDGSRVVDAISAAGGARKGVDLSVINLARKVVDGEQIYLGVKPEKKKVGSKVFSGTVYVNRASISQFDSLSGIGPVLAKRIVDYRSANGPFVDIAELQKVPGIGMKTFERIKSRLSL